MFIAVLFIIAKTREQPKFPLTGEWIKKMWYIYTMEYYLISIKRRRDKDNVVHICNGTLVIKKNKIMPCAATWMDLQIIILSEVSQRKTSII